MFTLLDIPNIQKSPTNRDEKCSRLSFACHSLSGKPQRALSARGAIKNNRVLSLDGLVEESIPEFAFIGEHKIVERSIIGMSVKQGRLLLFRFQ